MMRRIGYCVLVMAAAIGITAGICSAGDVVINEVAWAGTAANASDEWIELHNTTDTDIDMSGWILRFDTDGIVIHLGAVEGDTLELRRVVIDAGGYFLLERTDDTTVSDIEADLIYKGTLSNAGMLVELIGPAGDVLDLVDASDVGWPAGLAGDEKLPYATMERSLAPGELEWTDNNPDFASGLDANGEKLSGTPKAENAVVIFRAVAPKVDWTKPPQSTVSGVIVVEWSAIDPDGPDEGLRIGIAFLPSDGSDAVTVAEQLANAGSYALDTTSLPNGPGQLVVSAADGDGFSNTAISEEFEISNAP